MNKIREELKWIKRLEDGNLMLLFQRGLTRKALVCNDVASAIAWNLVTSGDRFISCGSQSNDSM